MGTWNALLANLHSTPRHQLSCHLISYQYHYQSQQGVFNKYRSFLFYLSFWFHFDTKCNSEDIYITTRIINDSYKILFLH